MRRDDSAGSDSYCKKTHNRIFATLRKMIRVSATLVKPAFYPATG